MTAPAQRRKSPAGLNRRFQFKTPGKVDVTTRTAGSRTFLATLRKNGCKIKTHRQVKHLEILSLKVAGVEFQHSHYPFHVLKHTQHYTKHNIWIHFFSRSSKTMQVDIAETALHCGLNAGTASVARKNAAASFDKIVEDEIGAADKSTPGLAWYRNSLVIRYTIAFFITAVLAVIGAVVKKVSSQTEWSILRSASISTLQHLNSKNKTGRKHSLFKQDIILAQDLPWLSLNLKLHFPDISYFHCVPCPALRTSYQ